MCKVKSATFIVRLTRALRFFVHKILSSTNHHGFVLVLSEITPHITMLLQKLIVAGLPWIPWRVHKIPRPNTILRQMNYFTLLYSISLRSILILSLYLLRNLAYGFFRSDLTLP
jgi:hypothetical protein